MPISTKLNSDQQGRGIFTRYADGSPLGDVIPFFDEGTYHIFSLTPPPGTLYFPERLRTTWRHLRSTDLISWEQLPDALTPGGDDEPDRDGVWTGSVIRVGDVYNIFYTGHSLERAVPQSVCRATSRDGTHWAKDPDNPVSVPDLERFEGKDWRDPFVFWNEVEERYWMLVSSRSLSHPAPAARCSSSANFRRPRLLEPRRSTVRDLSHPLPRVPGDLSAGRQVGDGLLPVHRPPRDCLPSCRGIAGPWRQFSAEGPDGPNWYAAKSLTDDGGRRIAFGWVPDRDPAPPAGSGKWLWGGDLAVPRELRLSDEDHLGVSLPNEVYASAQAIVPWANEPGTGTWSIVPSGPECFYNVESIGQFGYCVLRPAAAGDHFVVSATVSDAKDAATIGIAVQTSDRLDRGVAILCYPREGRVSAVDLTASQSELASEDEKTDSEYGSVTESALGLEAGAAITMQVVVRGDLVEAFVASSASLTYRLPRVDAGVIALVVQDGSVRFSDVKIAYVGATTAVTEGM